MTALIVIAAVILFFALALNIKLRIQVRYTGGGFDFRLKYLWFTIYPLKEKKPRKKRRTKKSKHDLPPKDFSDISEDVKADRTDKSAESDNAEDTVSEFEEDNEAGEGTTETARKERISDKLDRLAELTEKIKIIWGFSEKRLRKIFTHIYIENLMIDFIVASEDSCKTAVSYGAVSAAVYNGISMISTLFPTKVKSVDIVCDFDRKKPVYDAAVNVTARPSTLLSAVLGILVGFIKNYKKIMGKSDKRQTNEAAAQL